MASGYVNSYIPPLPKSPIVLPDLSKPYDVNFCFPVKPLETDRVKLVPFIPYLHAAALFNAIIANPETMRYMPFSTPNTLEEFEVFCEDFFRRDPGRCLYVVLDKTRLAPKDETDSEKAKSALMGTLDYINGLRELSTAEVAFVIVFPQYQRTHVNTHAVGLLMHPQAAERLGSKFEGIIRWQRPLPAGRESSAPFRSDDSLGLPGRHTAMLAICWDDWENGGKEHIQKLVNRKT
ncbi:acyl-CoA N-acyltransferase [Rhizoctonia solani]|uniref:Acyl-CoA N-acyltransferase n=1 Tax=Rhizoctonia solani TaxID=456999 RepID=A0A8H7M140_9AGAM|nr:acyl-CoA N-acyltransferase [Rhizoctonia solani]